MQKQAKSSARAVSARSPRKWIRLVLLSSLALVIWALLLKDGQEADVAGKSSFVTVHNERPPLNVLLFTLDTARADHIGAYGYSDVRTPTIDALAKGGVLFQRAIATAPVTLPSHSSIMTGLYPPKHGVRDNGTFALSEEAVTLAEILHDADYVTGAFVGAAVLEQRYGLTQGFDVYDDDFSKGRRRPLFMYAERRCEQVVSAALPWLEEKKNEPFFGWLHFYDPHASYNSPEPWATEYETHPYDGEIAYTDHCIGTVIDALRDWGLWTTTLVVIAADHGESLGEHGEKTHGLFIYDATVRIPLIFHAPLHLPAGQIVETIVSQVDILPTILALLGQALPQQIDGQNLVRLMRGQGEARRRMAYSETLLPKYHYGWAELTGMTSQTWKLIEAPRPEFYSLQQDPKELVNVYEREQLRVRNFRKALTGVVGDSAVPETRLDLEPEIAERLRGLGYIWQPPSSDVSLEAAPDPKDMLATHEHMQQGREYMRQDRYDEAIAEFETVIKINPKSISTYFDLASAYVEKGTPDLARHTLSTVLSFDPQNPRAYTMMGVIETRLKRTEEARALFQRALDVDPHYLGARVHLAGLWQQQGKLDKAEDTVREALQLVPTHTGALGRLGSILLAKGDIAGAEDKLRAALQSDPYDALVHRTFGILHDQAGRPDQALHAYQEALKTHYRLADVHNAIGIIYTKQGKLGRAGVHIKEALRINPTYTDAWISLGIVYDQKGLTEKAIDANAQALKTDSQAYQAYGNMAVLYLKDGQLDKVEELLQQGLTIKPDYPEAHNTLAVLYMKTADTSRAIRAAEQALRYRPDYPEALTNLGILYDRQGKFDQALAYHQRAIATNPAYWKGRYRLALTLMHMGRYDTAAEELKTVLQMQTRIPSAHRNLGDLYFEHLDDWAQARHHYEIYLRLVPAAEREGQVQTRLAQIMQR